MEAILNASIVFSMYNICLLVFAEENKNKRKFRLNKCNLIFRCGDIAVIKTVTIAEALKVKRIGIIDMNLNLSLESELNFLVYRDYNCIVT